MFNWPIRCLLVPEYKGILIQNLLMLFCARKWTLCLMRRFRGTEIQRRTYNTQEIGSSLLPLFILMKLVCGMAQPHYFTDS